LSEAVSKIRQFERLRDTILGDIREGRLTPGDKLPAERSLSDQYGISRHAVREALRTLEMSGVLRFTKGASGGAFIRESTGDGVSQSIRDMIMLGRMPLADLVAVRINLLVHAIELAVVHATDAEFDELDRNIDETEAAIALRDGVSSIGPVLEFNILLGRMSHNLVLAMLIDSLAMIMKDLLRIYRLVTEVDVIGPRRAIVAALRARDAATAVALLREQFALTTQYVVDRAQLPTTASNGGA
jgi:GntR family transcriptional repressor for pyruvate dehydrogenase complex